MYFCTMLGTSSVKAQTLSTTSPAAAGAAVSVLSSVAGAAVSVLAVSVLLVSVAG